ncbi:MAG: CHAT domain-containing protein [Hydrococcus sp. Prado102]|jgi:CHAT domain-containing protein/Flp pilus assembly protein TadD|nr:CHAT domain-containing protein [Hydrococcus sp. Prado102]
MELFALPIICNTLSAPLRDGTQWGEVIRPPYLLCVRYSPQIYTQAIDSRKIQADQLYKEADFFIQSNMMQAAQVKLEQALQLYKAIADTTGQRETLTSMGYVSYSQGNYREALNYLRQAESIRTDFSQQGRLLTTQGLVYLELGEYRRAYATLLRAMGLPTRDIAQENRKRIALGETLYYMGAYREALNYLQLAQRTSGDRNDYGRTLNAIGDVYLELGQYEEAKTYYQQALAVRNSNGDRMGTLRTLSNIGRVEQALGDSQAALKLYSQSLDLAESLGDLNSQAIILNNLGLVALDLGLKNQAIGYLEQALSITRNFASGRVRTLISLGLFYSQQDEYDKAIDYYQQALAWARQNGDRIGETKALKGLGETFLKQKKTSEAIKALQTSAEVFEEYLRPGLRDDQKISLFETQSSLYSSWQTALVEQGNYTQALEVAERGRARAFVELLAQRLSDNPDLDATVKFPTVAEIQAIAKNQQATLVTYSIVSNSEIYVWVIQPNSNIGFQRIDLKPIEIKQQGILANNPSRSDRDEQTLTNLVVSLRETGIDDTASTSQANSSLRETYNLLIQPIADLLPVQPEARVIFIPQGSLFLVPFQALQDASGKFLIERHTILYASSIQALTLTKKQPKTNPSSLVIGNPVPMPENLIPLPGSETEAKAIAEILATQPIIRENATEATVLEKISQAGTIHFATHGLLNDREAWQSSLALVASQNHDGLLTAGEIFDLKLQADLAVLSACDTGRGKITGDGTIGLSRSLLTAGVSSVVVSLWEVPDKPTASLMVEFYRNLQKSPDKAQALRQAMLTQMKLTPSPRDWAGFVLIGSAD